MDENAQSTAIEALPEQENNHVLSLAEAVSGRSKPQQNYEDDTVYFAAPLNDKGRSCFYLVSDTDKLTITNDSQMLFAALTKQLGRALNRTRLEEQLNKQLTEQKQELQNELAQLKHDMQSSSMFYCSAAMEQLMRQAKRAAMTDTTTLIIGESGTGKERLVNTLHKLGGRKDNPLVIVDCGAIPETLIESELFGHVKGAFTGAQNSSKGKVYEADGGTLMLDEIGELPLQMQTKLLRFVQEKHFTPVGGNKAETVDVKIIAVTNRELEEEVAKGNFRQDLFYRLNVLTLRTPPLRARPEDVPLLSKHFLKKFAQQFSHSEKRLSADALTKMHNYSWPGNIRELENRLMQANLLCESDLIEWADLKIESTVSEKQAPAPVNEAVLPDQEVPAEMPQQAPQEQVVSHAPAEQKLTTGEKAALIRKLHHALGREATRIMEQEEVMNFPIGRWLEDDLIYLTYLALDNSVKLAGLRLGVSHSTLRRRIDKLLPLKNANLDQRPEPLECSCQPSSAHCQRQRIPRT